MKYDADIPDTLHETQQQPLKQQQQSLLNYVIPLYLSMDAEPTEEPTSMEKQFPPKILVVRKSCRLIIQSTSLLLWETSLICGFVCCSLTYENYSLDFHMKRNINTHLYKHRTLLLHETRGRVCCSRMQGSLRRMHPHTFRQ